MIKRETVHKFFEVSLFLKASNAVLEITGGIIFSVISLERINYFIYVLTQGELSEDPRDFIANHLVNFFQSLSVNSQLFGSFYLISHGLIKIFLIIALWKRKLWAYTLSVVVFTFFIVYQLFRYTYNSSISLLVLTFIDVFVVMFIILEYYRIKNNSFGGPTKNE
jgi:uncharacterized membrane protein